MFSRWPVGSSYKATEFHECSHVDQRVGCRMLSVQPSGMQTALLCGSQTFKQQLKLSLTPPPHPMMSSGYCLLHHYQQHCWNSISGGKFVYPLWRWDALFPTTHQRLVCDVCSLSLLPRNRPPSLRNNLAAAAVNIALVKSCPILWVICKADEH